jgi:hypothetical protein
MRKQYKKMPLEKGSTINPRREKGPYSKADSQEKENSPSLSHIPKRSLDFILHYLALDLIKKSKQPSSSSFSQQRHHYFLFQYYKNFKLKGRLKGAYFRGQEIGRVKRWDSIQPAPKISRQ